MNSLAHFRYEVLLRFFLSFLFFWLNNHQINRMWQSMAKQMCSTRKQTKLKKNTTHTIWWNDKCNSNNEKLFNTFCLELIWFCVFLYDFHNSVVSFSTCCCLYFSLSLSLWLFSQARLSTQIFQSIYSNVCVQWTVKNKKRRKIINTNEKWYVYRRSA